VSGNGHLLLDATFVTAPVWDAPPDFDHLDERTSDAEILSLTGSALGVVVDGKLNPELPSAIATVLSALAEGGSGRLHTPRTATL
jgi:hypothetical protein